MSIFIFDLDTLEYYNWDGIRNSYKVLKRYDLSIENLEELDFIVSYPSTNWMIDNVKMYP